MPIEKVYIDATVAQEPLVKDIRRRMGLPAEIIDDARALYARLSQRADSVAAGKTVVLLTRNRGAFLKDCPGTREYTCCDYRILNIGTFCPMDCSYCIMQSYFHPPLLQFFVNRDDLQKELDTLFAGRQVCRIGTGEFTDSLVWELWTDLSQWLVPKFGAQRFAALELKSKTIAVGALEHLAHNKKTIVSWSLNTPSVIRSEERGTASLEARLDAAAKCRRWGYPLAFHLDPMIIYEGCREDYRRMVQRLFSRVAPGDVAWISLGTFRFMPPLKPIIEKRFPQSKIVYGEFVAGLDGKMRYFKPMRIELYRSVARAVRECAPDVPIYFCMEDDEVWKKSLGFIPADRGGLPRMLDERAVQMCGLDADGLRPPRRSSGVDAEEWPREGRP